MSDFPVYRQHDKMDCGPTCLRMVAKYHGKELSLETLRRYSEIGRNGVSLLGISLAAEKIGFKTTGVTISFQQLIEDISKPCIVHWNRNHFVVVTGKSGNSKVTVADPAKGLIEYSKNDFLDNWVAVEEADIEKGIVLSLDPTPDFFEMQHERSKGLGWGLLARYTISYKAQLVQLFIGLLLGSVLQLIFPFLTQSIVDTGINTRNLNFIQLILIAQFALFFARTAVEFIRSRILLYISTQINIRLLSDFWMKLMRLPLLFFDTRHTGDILQRINDHKRIEGFITGTALQTIFSLFSLVTFGVVLLYFNVMIFFIFAAGSMLYFLWIRLFLKYRRELDHKRFSVLSSENTATMQLIHGMQEIKLNNAEHLKRWEWEGIQASLFKLNFKSLSLNQYQQAGAFFINEGKNILITYLVAVLVLKGELTLGGMLAIQYIIGQLNSPVELLIQFTQQAQDAKISLERLNEVHQQPDEEPAELMLRTSLPADQGIIVKNLSFTYPGAGNLPVLKNIDTVFPAGKVTAIVGMSGSGKTTLLKLVQKFYVQQEGDIKVGEVNLKHLSPYYWRSICGTVMQDGFIFNDSIEKNIAVGDEIPDRDGLHHASGIANIREYVEGLPLGFNTRIGAEGNGLSGGQRQRLLIARAVYKDPRYIFFDEATNALDANNERAIMQNLREFFKGRTVVIVAHRLSTVKDADKIIVLQDGSICEEGTHEELAALRGKYFELVKNQLELGS